MNYINEKNATNIISLEYNIYVCKHKQFESYIMCEEIYSHEIGFHINLMQFQQKIQNHKIFHYKI